MTSRSPQIETRCRVTKVNADLGVVYGWAIVCKENGEDYFDLQGDHIPEDEMCRATIAFMKGARAAKVMHEGQTIGEVVLAMTIDTAVAKALGMEAPAKTGLFIGWAPTDKALVKRFLPGPAGEPPEWTGFSLGGNGDREAVAA